MALPCPYIYNAPRALHNTFSSEGENLFYVLRTVV